MPCLSNYRMAEAATVEKFKYREEFNQLLIQLVETLGPNTKSGTSAFS